MRFKVKDLLITVLPDEAERNEFCELHTRVCLNPTAEPCGDCTLLATCFRTDCGATLCDFPTKPGTCCEHPTCGECTKLATCHPCTQAITCGACTQFATCHPCTHFATCGFPTDPCGDCTKGTFCQIPTKDPCKGGTFCHIPTDDPCGGCTKLGTFCHIPTDDPCGCTHIGTECQFASKGPCIGGSIGPCLGSREPWIRVRNAEDIAALRESLKATLAKLDKLDESVLRDPGSAEPKDLDRMERRLKEALEEVRAAKSKRDEKK